MLILPYQKKWALDFLAIQKVLFEALLGLKDISIEHVGSTSVPDLAAKPIIDIDIVFPPSVDFENIKHRLNQIGYYHNGNQGISNREAFKRHIDISKQPVLDEIVHHLYVCPSHSEELKRHLLFRDYLRQYKTARNQYESLKYRIAEEAEQDRTRYSEIKEIKAKAFIQSILEKAKTK